MSRLSFLLVGLHVLWTSAAIAGGPPVESNCTTQSANFHLRSFRDGPAGAEVLARCEQLRTNLRRLWLSVDDATPWHPRCEIVLHPTRASYLDSVGRGGGQTSGSSLIRFDEGRIHTRRIDLLVDQRGGLPALSHELTHVVLADRFGGKLPPRWLDEGIATLADSAEKRKLHYRDCREALRSGTALRLVEMFELERFASARQVAAFYGQSLSLVHFLYEQKQPETIVDFAEAAMERGYDSALRQYYAIDGVAALERQWRTSADAGHNTAQPVDILADR